MTPKNGALYNREKIYELIDKNGISYLEGTSDEELLIELIEIRGMKPAVRMEKMSIVPTFTWLNLWYGFNCFSIEVVV